MAQLCIQRAVVPIVKCIGMIIVPMQLLMKVLHSMNEQKMLTLFQKPGPSP